MTVNGNPTGVPTAPCRGGGGVRWSQVMGVFMAGLVGCYVSFEMDTLQVALVVFSVFSITTIWVWNREQNWLHPMVVFPLFYYPYSTWYSYHSIAMNINELSSLTLSVNYAFVGLLAFSVTSMGMLHSVNGESPAFPRMQNKENPFAEKMLMWIFIGLVLISIRKITGFEYDSKSELLNADTLSLRLTTFSFWELTVLTLLVGVRWFFAGTRPDRLMYVVFALAVLAYSVIGERDYLFRIAICFSFIYFDRRRSARLYVVLALLVLVTVLIPWGQQFKAAFAMRTGGDTLQTGGFFLNEFGSASRNLYILLFKGYESSWSFLWNDFIRGIVPFGARMGYQSATGWFDQVYRFDEGIQGSSGWGLGLVAEGCLAGGIPGIILVLSFVSFL